MQVLLSSLLRRATAESPRPPVTTTLGLVVGLSLLGSAMASGVAAEAPTLASARPGLQAAFDRYVSARGVDYRAFHKDAVARRALSQFVEAAAGMKETSPLSDWLNVYNAIVLHQVLEHYPIKSVMDVPGFFDKKRLRVAGKQRSLDDIENRLVRPRFKDARVHMALNCGAVSCPSLAKKLFREAGLDRQLQRLTAAALSQPRHVRVRGGALQISEIFFWFADDFTREAGDARAWIERHSKPGRFAALPKDAAVTKRPYDWALNQR